MKKMKKEEAKKGKKSEGDKEFKRGMAVAFSMDKEKGKGRAKAKRAK